MTHLRINLKQYLWIWAQSLNSCTQSHTYFRNPEVFAVHWPQGNVSIQCRSCHVVHGQKYFTS